MYLQRKRLRRTEAKLVVEIEHQEKEPERCRYPVAKVDRDLKRDELPPIDRYLRPVPFSEPIEGTAHAAEVLATPDPQSRAPTASLRRRQQRLFEPISRSSCPISCRRLPLGISAATAAGAATRLLPPITGLPKATFPCSGTTTPCLRTTGQEINPKCLVEHPPPSATADDRLRPRWPPAPTQTVDQNRNNGTGQKARPS